ncbi:MAG: hypothetical protein IK012_09550 [Fibrobacter sp.]|uniref:hypothetical protein n=1 Tax=Fibrobacter sp. TaxID=35828 RepID=UPI0025C715FF|nr:hypothetical protein [Fibrobacter sp.]MBR4785478.1 hypothetical protein [Fibrobacter sp.]
MKIEKKGVFGNKPLSTAAKRAIAATLGITAAFTLNACDDSTSAKDDSPEPLGGIVVPDYIPPDLNNSSEAASSSSQAETAPSSSSLTEGPASSSQTIDIPLSHEPVSSSLMEAISSALESSSSAAEPTSSTIAPESSAIAPTSSESVPASSASQPTEQELKDACHGAPGGTSVDIGGQMYLCPDTGGGMMFSMISTFERTDVEV